jgi:hypothetical protein
MQPARTNGSQIAYFTYIINPLQVKLPHRGGEFSVIVENVQGISGSHALRIF